MKKIVIVFFLILINLLTMPLQFINKSLATNSTSTTNISFFDDSISFNWEYVQNDSTMPYGLFTPSNANKLDSVPLIVWLHGYGEVGKGEKELINSGLPAVLKKWQLEGFSAYVLCPHAKRKWNNTTSESQVKELLDKIISEYNIDTQNIILVGHSVGGQGALYLGYSLSQYFSKIVVLSGYTTDNWSKITKPIIFYCGRDGEDESCIKHMKNSFIPTYGSDNCFWLNANHGAVPKKAFTEDNGTHCGIARKWSFRFIRMDV